MFTAESGSSRFSSATSADALSGQRGRDRAGAPVDIERCRPPMKSCFALAASGLPNTGAAT
jgi:hypothetical protein